MSQYNDALLQIKPTEDVTDDTHPFFDKKIAISGTLFLKRKELVQYIVNNGGTYTINDDMDILIHGKNRGNTPSKKEQIVRNKLAMGKDIVLINNEKLKRLIEFYDSL
nr:BRCT domain-containing protein [Jeotgalicoccus schoeneichii]